MKDIHSVKLVKLFEYIYIRHCGDILILVELCDFVLLFVHTGINFFKYWFQLVANQSGKYTHTCIVIKSYLQAGLSVYTMYTCCIFTLD